MCTQFEQSLLFFFVCVCLVGMCVLLLFGVELTALCVAGRGWGGRQLQSCSACSLLAIDSQVQWVAVAPMDSWWDPKLRTSQLPLSTAAIHPWNWSTWVNIGPGPALIEEIDCNRGWLHWLHAAISCSMSSCASEIVGSPPWRLDAVWMALIWSSSATKAASSKAWPERIHRSTGWGRMPSLQTWQVEVEVAKPAKKEVPCPGGISYWDELYDVCECLQFILIYFDSTSQLLHAWYVYIHLSTIWVIL